MYLREQDYIRDGRAGRYRPRGLPGSNIAANRRPSVPKMLQPTCLLLPVDVGKDAINETVLLLPSMLPSMDKSLRGYSVTTL